MTMWSDSHTTLVGGSCEYANAANGGVNSPAATSPYVGTKYYCAADDALYAGGAACGNCYRVWYDGSPATDPGRAGEAIVQIVDSGSAKTFDCHVDPFEQITGSRTGVFPISYEPVLCETAYSGAVVAVLDGSNAWFTKVVFSNLKSAVLSAELAVGGRTYVMSRVGGATWRAQLTGLTGAVEFRVTLDDGTATFGDCFEGAWPVPTGSSCSTMHEMPAPTPAPTPGPTPAPTPAPSGIQSGNTIFLKAHTGKRITVQGEEVHAKWGHQGGWQALVIEKQGGGAINMGDTVYLRAHTHKYLSIWDTRVVAKWGNKNNWEALVVESDSNGPLMPGSQVWLRAHTGKRITVQGEEVHAKWDHRGGWQALTVELKTDL